MFGLACVRLNNWKECPILACLWWLRPQDESWCGIREGTNKKEQAGKAEEDQG